MKGCVKNGIIASKTMLEKCYQGCSRFCTSCIQKSRSGKYFRIWSQSSSDVQNVSGLVEALNAPGTQLLAALELKFLNCVIHIFSKKC